MRGGETITISDLSLDVTIHEIKTQYAANSSQPLEKIKLLLNKKPAADLKTLKELGVAGDAVEFSVMIMGGAASSTPTPAMANPVVEKSEASVVGAFGAASAGDQMDIDRQQGSGPESEQAQAEVSAPEETASRELKTDVFWDDLQGFLTQRLRDEKAAERLAKIFKEAAGN